MWEARPEPEDFSTKVLKLLNQEEEEEEEEKEEKGNKRTAQIREITLLGNTSHSLLASHLSLESEMVI